MVVLCTCPDLAWPFQISLQGRRFASRIIKPVSPKTSTDLQIIFHTPPVLQIPITVSRFSDCNPGFANPDPSFQNTFLIWQNRLPISQIVSTLCKFWFNVLKSISMLANCIPGFPKSLSRLANHAPGFSDLNPCFSKWLFRLVRRIPGFTNRILSFSICVSGLANYIPGFPKSLSRLANHAPGFSDLNPCFSK